MTALGMPVSTLAMKRDKVVYFPSIFADILRKSLLNPNWSEHNKPNPTSGDLVPDY